MSWKTFPFELIESRHVTPSVLQLTFRRADGERLEYQPGQFINIHFEHDGKPVHRSYSIANPPDGGLIEIAMSPVEGGLATSLLSNLRPGEVIDASGPYGRFVLRDDAPTRYVLVATGTGVTPYRAMLPELAKRLAQGFTVELLLGIWRREESLYADDFLAAARTHDGFAFQACYSREMPGDPTKNELSGHVQKHFDRLDLDPGRDIVYLCGNPNMIDEAVEYLRAMKFPTAQMRREKYLSAKS